MILPSKKIVLSGAVFLVAIGFFNAFGAVKYSLAVELETGQVLWKHLSYQGKHFLGKVEAVVSLTGLPAKEAHRVLIPIPEGNPLQATTTHVLVFDVQSVADPLFGANDLTGSQAWFSPLDIAALQRIRSRKGDDIWQNTYRFTEKGVYRLRKKPGRTDQKKLAPEHWTKIKESFYPYHDKRPGSRAVLEPTGLLYLVSAFDFMKQTAPLSLYVFDRKQLHQVRVHVSGRQRLKVSYIEKTLEKDIRREGMIDAVKISFKPRAMVPQDEQPEEFSFMGLRGDFEIYIDRATRIPVQVSGQISRIGKVDIRLQTVEF
ncbi:MAG: hypothetical protein WBM69_04530 [Desulfobacterales bacterium]